SNGHNLLGVATDAGGFSGSGDKTGANPMLAGLADNGGPTKTMALSAGSAAIDAGVATGATFDQRGLSRTVNDPGVPNAATSDGTDMGAFEKAPSCSLTCPANIIVNNDTDKCGAIVNYRGRPGAGCGKITCDHASGSFFGGGETMVTCTSSAGPTCTFKVTVKDTQAPVITISGQPVSLWPPNHNYKTVTVTDLVTSVSDNCRTKLGISNVRITKVTSDEPDNGVGDGNTVNDIVIANNCKSVQLRAERQSNGNGRVYTITFKLTDASGNVGTATAKVTVPHAQNGPAAVDDGPVNTIVSACP
ncbi:MAG: choice-of-anchor Q domain-containing protein, partial [bacterium]